MQVPQPARLVTLTLIDFYLHLGRFAEALETARGLVLRSVNEKTSWVSVSYLAWIYAMMGAFDRAEFWLDRDLDDAVEPLQSRLYQSEFGLHFGRPGYARSVLAFENLLSVSELPLTELPEFMQAWYGAMLALAGAYGPAIETLERLNSVGRAPQILIDEGEIDVRHALAWAWLQSGESTSAEGLLTSMQEVFSQYDETGRLEIGWYLLAYARNELLLGNIGRALGLLEQAERAGWRDYYHVVEDPRWEPVRENARFQAVMARVKASIDTQRSQIEESSPEFEFIERLDAAIRASAQSNSN
jgi:tetratricopeptide (TPR) repeat protein